ncbi:MAG: leucyl/phenylalanyl-tRNA--protein transferase [Desulfobulbaceae bacterium]|nr:leucyl/phenylalanyl-tRNA--protein transferase [Desulfobulbaceae bacterium]
MPVFALNASLVFPPPELARGDGLLAVGGDLAPERLLLAYRQGIFPWYGPGEPLLWWAPNPRLVLFPAELRVSRRLARTIRQGRFRVAFDCDFANVIRLCGEIRQDSGTWLNPQLMAAFCRLHELGYAHSVACYHNEELVGGLYGLALDRVFFGESMFSLVPDSSKVALVGLVAILKQLGFYLIDCQVRTDHLLSLGAREINGKDFAQLLRENIGHTTPAGSWSKFLFPSPVTPVGAVS